MQIYITQNGQTMDDVVYYIYGDRPQMLGPVIAANPLVLGGGVNFPEGITINLPPIVETSKTVKTINLWD